MPDDVIAYLCAGNAPDNFACYCHKCNRHPNNSMTHSAVLSESNEGLLQLKKRLTSIENLLNCDRISQPTILVILYTFNVQSSVNFFFGVKDS